MNIKIDSLIYNKHTGIVKALYQTKNDSLEKYITIKSKVTNSKYFHINYPIDYIASGSSLSYERSVLSSIGEAIERYCCNIIEDMGLEASILSLKSEGKKYLDPRKVVNYKRYQYDEPNFPFKEFTDTSKTYWINSTDINTNETILVPLNLVYVNYLFYNEDIKYNFPNVAGVSAGDGIEMAIQSAVTEVIERDASVRWWYTKELDGFLIEKEHVNEHLIFCSYLIKSVVPTVATFLFDNKNNTVNVGFACRFDIESAIEKSKAESAQLRQNALLLLNDVDISDEDRAYKLLKPNRPDRKYMDSYKRNYRDLYDLIHNTQIYLDPRMKEKVDHYQCGEIKKVDFDFPSSIPDLMKHFRDIGQQVLITDITTKDVKTTNLRVVRAILPGYILNAPTPYLPLDESVLFDIPPIPHS